MGSWTEAKVCEEVGGKVGSCLLLRGVPKGGEEGRGVQGNPTAAMEKVPCRAARAVPMMMTTTTVVVMVVVELMVVVVVKGGKGKRRGDETPERRRESPAQRGPVPHCMADLETRSPQGETRGPKRRPRRIGRNSRESRLLVRMLVIARARETRALSVLRPSTVTFFLFPFYSLSFSFSLTLFSLIICGLYFFLTVSLRAPREDRMSDPQFFVSKSSRLSTECTRWRSA